MKRNIIAVLLITILCAFTFAGCGASGQGQENISSNEVEYENSQEADVADDGSSEAEGIVDVDKGVFDVTMTVPAEYMEGVTQEELDESVQAGTVHSATLNDDGSVTYVMSKSQHKQLMDEMTQTVDEYLDEIVGSEDYPNITSATANDDYTVFTIVTKNEEPDMNETFLAMALYMYGGMYNSFNGVIVDNIHVDFLNDASGENILGMDSKDLANE